MSEKQTPLTSGGKVLRVGVMAFVAAVAAAIFVQDHTDALPLGLFNEGRETYAWLSLACLALTVCVLVILGVELFQNRALRLAGWLRATLGSLLFLELLLYGVDVTLVSRGEAPPLGGPYRELQTAEGDWVFVKKPHAASKLGFRHTEVAVLRPTPARVLFLGDSYTEGSGRAFACNYPEVAAATLSKGLGKRVEAFNAGVAGYGPADAARLFAHLLEEGYRFDAVVFSLFSENDLTDNLPGTTRRVVAGINFRFPESDLLRWLHPLNSRGFRYGLFIDRASRLVRSSGGAARRDDGTCELDPIPQDDFPEGLQRLARRRFESNYGPAPRRAMTTVTEALQDIRATATSAQIPAILAVFPDRVLVDRSLANSLDLELNPDSSQALLRTLGEIWPGPIDLRPALTAGSENYRASDTHLSDVGNLRAGRRLGQALIRHVVGRPGF